MNKQILRYENYMQSPKPYWRLNQEALTTVATWAENHNKPVMLGDLPRQHFLYNALQDLHLLDLYDAMK